MTASLTENDGDDSNYVVATSQTLGLGTGWSPLQVDRDGQFRIAEHGATLVFSSRTDAIDVITLDAEPEDPSNRLVVSVGSSRGQPFTTVSLAERQSFCAVVPATRSDAATLQLSIERNGKPARMRVRSLTSLDLAGDIIVSRRMLLLSAHGWYDNEAFADLVFRWIDNDAEIFFLDAFRGSQLSIDLAPGPSILGSHARVVIFDDRGRKLTTAEVARRGRIEVRVDPQKSRGIRLHVENGGAGLSNDQRNLNLQIFGVRISDP